MNRGKRWLTKWTLVPAVLVIGTGLCVSFLGQISQFISQQIPVPYHKGEEPLVEAAIREAYGAEASIADIKRHAYPVVVHLPDMKCVGFNLRRGVIGVRQTVCFKKSDESVAVRHSQ